MPPGFTPAICLRGNFVYLYLHFGEPGRQIHWAKLLKYCSGYSCQLSGKVVIGLTARPQKTKLSCILQQIFQHGGRPTCRCFLGVGRGDHSTQLFQCVGGRGGVGGWWGGGWWGWWWWGGGGGGGGGTHIVWIYHLVPYTDGGSQRFIAHHRWSLYPCKPYSVVTPNPLSLASSKSLKCKILLIQEKLTSCYLLFVQIA